MLSNPYNKGPMKEVEFSIKKEEREEKHLLSQSTIAQFLRSGQAAFGSEGPQTTARDKQTPDEVQEWMLDRVRERLAAASDLNYDDVLALRPLLKLGYQNNSTGLQVLLPELLTLMRSNLTYAVTFANHVVEGPTNEVPQALKDDLLHAVAKELDALSIDKRDTGTIDHQIALFEERKQEEAHQVRPLAKLSAPAFGLFTKHFCVLGLYKPIENMLVHLRSEIARGPRIDLHTIYVPYLQELIGLMLVYGIPMATITYSSFFESILRSYFELFVGQEPTHSDEEEHAIWTKRALLARSLLESFEHTYFRDILGKRYDENVLPALMKLPGFTPDTHAHKRFDSLTKEGMIETEIRT